MALWDGFAGALHTRDRVADVRAKRVALERDLLRFKAELDAARDRRARRTEPVNRLREYEFDD